MKKEKLHIKIWKDQGLSLFATCFVNSKGEIKGEVEYAPNKTLALQWLYQNAPEDLIKLTINTSDRYSAGSDL